MPDTPTQSPESLLKESEERYRALFDNASDMIQSVRPDGTFEFVNRAWTDTLGYTEDDLATLIVWDIIQPDQVSVCQGHFMAVMEGGSLTDYRTTFVTRDGQAIPVEGSVQGRWLGETILATHGFFRDISERLRAEELEVRNRELELERQARFLEKMAALGKLSAGLSHELNNPAAAARRSAQRLGDSLAKRDRATGELFAHGVTPAGFARLEQMVEQCFVPEPAPAARSLLDASRAEDEIQEWLDDRGVAEPWAYAESLVRGGVTVAALEELTGQLPDQAIAPAIAWIGETLALREHADVIDRSTGRMSDLVGAIKSYSFRDQATEQDVDIHSGIEDTLVILAYRLRTMTVDRQYDRAIPPVRTYGSSLNQVWTNILDNAVDATNGTGAVTIRTRGEGENVVVEITDDGCGIPADQLSRIFEPFYTTKEQGAGTGLGLDTAWRIVTDEHGGKIEAESEPGRTTFRVTIPICPDLTAGG